MDSKTENSVLKRKHDEDNSDQNKRNKLEIPEEGDEVTKITDVIDDCLEHIFKYLTLRDLINLADTCKSFKSSIKLAFATKCKGKVMELRPEYSSFQPIKLIGNIIRIWDLSSCLKVLRHFGSLITKLKVFYCSLTLNESAALARYMNEYCADSSNDIIIYGATKQVMAKWIKPFSNVESIEIYRSDLGDLNTWFPKMRRLVLGDGSQFITNTFPYLEELKIQIVETGIKMKIKEMLRLNPNLQKLCLPNVDLDMKFMESISGYLQSLNFLHIFCNSKLFNEEVPPIQLKSAKELHIEFHIETPHGIGLISNIPISFDLSLVEKLRWKAKIGMTNHFVIEIMRQNPSVMYVEYELHPLLAEEMKMALSTKFMGVDVEMKQFTYDPVPTPIDF